MNTTKQTTINVLKRVLVWLPVQFVIIIILESIGLLPSDLFLNKSQVYKGLLGAIFNYDFTIYCCVLGILYTVVGCIIMECFGVNSKKAWKWTLISFVAYFAITALSLLVAKKTFPMNDYWFMILDVWFAPLIWLAEIEISQSIKKDSPEEKETSEVSKTIRNTLISIGAVSVYCILGAIAIQFIVSASEEKRYAKLRLEQTAAQEKAKEIFRQKHTAKPEGVTAIQNVILMDMSGSMSHLRNTVISGTNELIGDIRSAQDTIPELKQFLTLSVFDDNGDGLCLSDIARSVFVLDAADITEKDYAPRGCTPLYDAIAETIIKVDSLITPGTAVLMTVFTDGLENASKQYSAKTLQELIDKYQNIGWEFTFYGANQDAVFEAGKIGINEAYGFEPTDVAIHKALRHESARRIGRYGTFRR